MTTTTHATLAGQMYDAFETKRRENGEEFVALKEGSPEWMTDVIRAAHENGEIFPDDWRYSIVHEACGFISDQGESFDLDDDQNTFADDVDVYHASLLQWVAADVRRMVYVDTALEEYGAKDLGTALMQGQAEARGEIFRAVVDALDTVRAELESDESDDN